MPTPANCCQNGFGQAVTTDRNVASIPQAFPNIAPRNQTISACPHIQFAGAPACNMASITPTSNGDEGGCQGGVASGTFCSTARNTQGSDKLILSGTPATRMTNMTSQNSNNTTGSDAAPCQTKVFIN
ncbi:DUF4150 domain-containing protein [Lysobacter sp. BMK333-48F3]|uniref:PAAR-like domain-containing protein n=1 Tax=Lysobacter sp. BMK333-48F3 TaxID=2867962 RepID=UPI001C8B12ED|nr:PAAR-like domain-containing protein [Lysobacter sp. BMK333-48F3]MBX9403034.1 DUF4150 domain-containing protein [Lysobacter sp. BMK333-48F3]